MADVAWPDSMPPQLMVWTIQKAGVQSRSPYAPESVESVTFPGWFWRVSLTLKPRRSRDGGVSEGFFEGLAGGEDTVSLYHWLRQVPRGTMRGSPTVETAMVRGDQTIKITTAGTLLAGDLFKVGNVVYKTRYDCAPSSGVLTVPITAHVRVAAAVSDGVTWNRPTIKCVLAAMSHSSSYRPGAMEGAAIDLEEASS